jgi:hypothetical protein
MINNIEYKQVHSQTTTSLARTILVMFLLTFMLARMIVFLIMSHRIPDLYLHVKGSHVHHLNYGIFLLSGVGAYLIFARPVDKILKIVSGIYGVAMALTFDEFGMWIHLGGSYWQRASWDAVVILSAGFGLIAFAPSLKRFRPHHWITTLILILTLIFFLLLFFESFKYASIKLGPTLHQMESTAPK